MSTAVIDLAGSSGDSAEARAKTSTPETLLPLSYQPAEYDILLGEVVPITAKMYFHTGYEFFANLLLSLLSAYVSGNAEQRNYLCELAIHRVQQAHGRFVQQDPIHKRFFVVSIEQARERVHAGFWGILQAQQQRDAAAAYHSGWSAYAHHPSLVPAAPIFHPAAIHASSVGAPPPHATNIHPHLANALLEQELARQQNHHSERDASVSAVLQSAATSESQPGDNRNQQLLLQRIRQVVGNEEEAASGSTSSVEAEKSLPASKMVETQDVEDDGSLEGATAATSCKKHAIKSKPKPSKQTEDKRTTQHEKSPPKSKTSSPKKASKKKTSVKPALSKTSTKKLNSRTKKTVSKVSKKARSKKKSSEKGQILNSMDPQTVSETKKKAQNDSMPILRDEPPEEEEEENFCPIDQKPLVSKELLLECRTICLGCGKDTAESKDPTEDTTSSKRRVSPRLSKRNEPDGDPSSIPESSEEESPSKKPCLDAKSAREDSKGKTDSKSKKGKKKKETKPTVDTVWTWVDEQTATEYTHVLHM